jgi:YHS domain-containing protein
MQTLLYFAIWAGLFFLMMRFGCGSHVMGHGHAGHEGQGDAATPDTGAARWMPPETDIDPVCRTSVRTDAAKSSVYRGTVYYFCSAKHRDAFEADPERYIGETAGPEPRAMEHHHG